MPNEEMPLVDTDNLDRIGYNSVILQRDADLAILRVERLKEAEWLEIQYKNLDAAGLLSVGGAMNWQKHIASLKVGEDG